MSISITKNDIRCHKITYINIQNDVKYYIKFTAFLTFSFIYSVLIIRPYVCTRTRVFQKFAEFFQPPLNK